MDKILDWIDKKGIEHLIWAIDLDSTVLNPQIDPNTVVSPRGLETSCNKLDKKTLNAFFIITGRDLTFVDKVFPKTKFRVSAEYHNMARFNPNAAPSYLSPLPDWKLIDGDLDRLVLTRPKEEMFLRKKMFMRSLHYAQVPANDRAFIKATLQTELTTLLDTFSQKTGQKITLTDGGHIFDMGPVGANKGKALEDIIKHVAQSDAPNQPRFPIYFGDSPGDLPAAHVAKAHNGVFVAVGKDASVIKEADFFLKSPAQCRNLLSKVSRGLTKPKAP
ncbi:MAG: HAD-IIB family hydrolase [Alphaproteobacteria bacterium]